MTAAATTEKRDGARTRIFARPPAMRGQPYAWLLIFLAFVTVMAANAVDKAGSHDWPAINKAMLSTDFARACQYKIDKNNVLDNSVTTYKYNTDGTKKLLKVYPLKYLPPTELATTAPPTTAPPAG